MEQFRIQGKNRLCGEVTISGAKNAAVAILPATILAEGPCVIENVPKIHDVCVVLEILEELGATVRRISDNTLEIDTSHVNRCDVTHEQARHMRGSYYFLGALLGRFGRASVTLPGGCNLGARPIDLHTTMFEKLGCDVSTEYANVRVSAPQLTGTRIVFEKVSVGATINAMLAAAAAQGVTELENVAREPHIVDTANFLNSMGADITGAGTDSIKIRGVKSFHPCSYTVVPDQIEAGTYMAAAVATGGDILLKNVIPKHMEIISDRFVQAGATVENFDDSIRICRSGPLKAVNIKTMPYPGYPTDMQPIFGAVMACAEGLSTVTESIWGSRFRYTEQLRLMGAKIDVSEDERTAFIEGVETLHGQTVNACDLRAGAAMVVAALAASGETYIEDIFHIERGYERIIEKLTALGACIEKTGEP